MDERLSPADAGVIAGRARRLLRLGQITHHQYALLDALLWSFRQVGRASVRVAYSQLQKAAHVARSTVAEGLVVLEQLGLIEKSKARVLAVAANGGRVWKQLPNTYRLLVGGGQRGILRESAGRSDSKPLEFKMVVKVVRSRAQEEAQEALKKIAASRAAQRATKWLEKCVAMKARGTIPT